MSRKPEKKVYYISAVPRGNVRHLSSAERLDVYTGQLALDWAQIMREDLEMYMQYYRRNNSPAMTALLPSMAEKVLASYARYYVASLNHGRAIAAAPRRFGEESQAVTLEEIPAFFGLTTSEEIVPVRKNFTDQELQRINAIVRDNPEIAARFGMTESGANKGPNVDVAKARAAIAAAPDAPYFQEGYLPLGNVPGMGSAAAAAALPAPGAGAAAAMGSAGRPALPPPGLSGLLNMGSGAASAAMGSASGAASASGRNRALSLIGNVTGSSSGAAAAAAPAPAPAAAAPAPAPAAAAAPAAANNRGAAAGKSRGRGTGGPGAKRGRFASLASVAENAAGEAAGEEGAAAAPAPAGPAGGRRRTYHRKARKTHRKARHTRRRRTHHRRR